MSALKVNAIDLRPGDIYVNPDGAEMYTVISEPIVSTNQALFQDSQRNTCVVVGVQYVDGGRGSRLFDPDTVISVIRAE